MSAKHDLDFERLKRLKDINVELLETILHTLSSIKEYSEKYGVPLPTEDNFIHLVRKAINLIDEMNEEIVLSPNLQHRFKTPIEPQSNHNNTDPNLMTRHLTGQPVTRRLNRTLPCAISHSQDQISAMIFTGVDPKWTLTR